MRHITFSEARQNFAATLNRIEEDAEPAVITRVGHDPMVIVSLREYESLRETAYLQASPANARRLEAAVERHRQGQVEEHDLRGDLE